MSVTASLRIRKDLTVAFLSAILVKVVPCGGFRCEASRSEPEAVAAIPLRFSSVHAWPFYH
eukprot:COSAG01_NODE_3422_length_6115_cov_4.099402_6_plen_61_part_00